MCSPHKAFQSLSSQNNLSKGPTLFVYGCVCVGNASLSACTYSCLETKGGGVTQLNIVGDDDRQQADGTMHKWTACRGWCRLVPHTFFFFSARHAESSQSSPYTNPSSDLRCEMAIADCGFMRVGKELERGLCGRRAFSCFLSGRGSKNISTILEPTNMNY